MENKWLGLRYDYWLHLMAGYIIMITFLLFTDPLIAVVATAYIAWMKEWYDEYIRPSKFDIFDTLWTIIGGIIGYNVFEFAKSFGVL